ncbi:protein of unknown function [Candidatus Promineifilum breve]|uniref:Uncharacterized protein n=1 Tax=Candidatus Promineifilum breve TaxID=1806508 RepID=A0A160T7X8_9CHLR|nr:protein of unknown function [Candidatus Promineifilum breve]
MLHRGHREVTEIHSGSMWMIFYVLSVFFWTTEES